VRYSPLFSSLKNLNNLSKNNCLRGVILILLVRELIFIGWGFPFPIVLVLRYKLSFFFGKLTYVLKEEDTNIIRGIPQIYNDNRNIKQQMATG